MLLRITVAVRKCASLPHRPKFFYLLVQVSLVVTKSQCPFFGSLGSWMSSWILSSLVSERVFFLDHRDWDHFLVFVVCSSAFCLGCRVVCVLSCVSVVAGCGHVVKLIGTSPRTALSFALPPPLVLSLCQGVVELERSRCRVVGWNGIISSTLTAQSLLCCICDFEPTRPPSFRLPSMQLSFASVRGWVVGVVGWLVWLGCVVVMLTGTSPSPSLLFVRLCLLCLWYQAKMASFTLTLHGRVSVRTGLLLVGSSAFCCVGCLTRVVVMSIGADRVSCC